jgi:ubiquinone/menaquinone biosynthesis C-methylase UbiE
MKTRESGMPPEQMWDEFFDPPSILRKLGLKQGCRNVLEFGCGYGTFTIPAAQIIRGIVHALDIDPEMLVNTQVKADAANLQNIELSLHDFAAEGTGMPVASMDYVMLFNILHAEERMTLLKEAWRVLELHGRLAIIHWNYDANTPRGPSMTIRPRPEDCRAWAEQVGFRLLPPGLIDLPPYHYGFVFEKQTH